MDQMTVVPFLDGEGNFKVLAADKDGTWRPTVDFRPGRVFFDAEGRAFFKCTPWPKRAFPREERKVVLALPPQHVQAAVKLLKKRLEGLDVVTSEVGVVVVERRAVSRERVECASIWLSLAGQFLETRTALGFGITPS